MDTEPRPFQEGEYIILTRPYLGLPRLSVGVITQRYSTNPPLYLIHFGVDLPVGPFPQDRLAPLKRARMRGA